MNENDLYNNILYFTKRYNMSRRLKNRQNSEIHNTGTRSGPDSSDSLSSSNGSDSSSGSSSFSSLDSLNSHEYRSIRRCKCLFLTLLLGVMFFYCFLFISLMIMHNEKTLKYVKKYSNGKNITVSNQKSVDNYKLTDWWRLYSEKCCVVNKEDLNTLYQKHLNDCNADGDCFLYLKYWQDDNNLGNVTDLCCYQFKPLYLNMYRTYCSYTCLNSN